MIVSLFYAIELGVGSMAFAVAMRHRWGSFFTDNRDILELITPALPIAGLFELWNCPQTTECGMLRGNAWPTVGANINLESFYLVGMPVAFVFAFWLKMGFPGLWLELLAAQASCAMLMLVVLGRIDLAALAHRATELTAQNLLLVCAVEMMNEKIKHSEILCNSKDEYIVQMNPLIALN